MSHRTWIQIIAAVVVGVFALGLWTSGVAVQARWLRFYSLAVLAAGALITGWDRWAWQLRPFRHVRGVPPVLHGTWRGTLTSLWVDPTAGSRPAPKPAFLVVRQTASSAHAALFTDTARSGSTLAQVQHSAGGDALTYVYLATPDVLAAGGNPIHHGAVMLDITGRPGRRLRGRYWTDRESGGELDFTEHVSALADDFDEAAALFE
jgi:hypothetical protein